jgi:hypothetical protein
MILCPLPILPSLLLAVPSTSATQQGAGEPVTRGEYERLQSLYEELKKELEAMRAGLVAEPAVDAEETQEAIDDLERQIKELKQRADVAKPGTSTFLITGYGTTGFAARQGQDSTFSTTFNPIFLWRIDPRLLFEGEIEIEIEDGEGEFGLEYSNVSYLVNDYVTASTGLFLAPFGTWAERYHAAWINELPDAPLVFGHEGIAPTSLLGFQFRGGIPLGPTKINYALYVANGPALVTEDDMEAGTLDFTASTDLNNDKAVGGRVGFMPTPELEVGYSALIGRVDPSASDVGQVDATLQAVDLAYVLDSEPLGGRVKLRGEWIWSDVDDAAYDPSGALGFGPLAVDGNRREGGYVQLGYRPSKAESTTLRNLEFVARYDSLDLPTSAPENVDESRWTFGVDYWLTPSAVVKFAYQLDDKDDPAGIEEDANAVLFGLSMGF